MDGNLFYERATNFISEKAHLRRNGKHTFLVYDGHGSYIRYKTLKFLQMSYSTVAALPAHTSHVLQLLDAKVFGPLKDAFHFMLNRQNVLTTKGTKNDFF